MSEMTFNFHDTMKLGRAVYNNPILDKVVWNMANDPVNHPSHYTNGDIECIDAIKASMTHEEFIGYLKGCAFKYLWRYRLKEDPKQDLEKAQWYINKLNSVVNDSDGLKMGITNANN